jgi:hypothetical protein
MAAPLEPPPLVGKLTLPALPAELPLPPLGVSTTGGGAAVPQAPKTVARIRAQHNTMSEVGLAAFIGRFFLLRNLIERACVSARLTRVHEVTFTMK